MTDRDLDLPGVDLLALAARVDADADVGGREETVAEERAIATALRLAASGALGELRRANAGLTQSFDLAKIALKHAEKERERAELALAAYRTREQQARALVATWRQDAREWEQDGGNDADARAEVNYDNANDLEAIYAKEAAS